MKRLTSAIPAVATGFILGTALTFGQGEGGQE